MGAQLSLKAAMPFAEILAMCRKSVSNTGPWVVTGSHNCLSHVWYRAIIWTNADLYCLSNHQKVQISLGWYLIQNKENAFQYVICKMVVISFWFQCASCRIEPIISVQMTRSLVPCDTITRNFDVFLWCTPKQTVEQNRICRWFDTPWCSSDVTVTHSFTHRHIKIRSSTVYNICCKMHGVFFVLLRFDVTTSWDHMMIYLFILCRVFHCIIVQVPLWIIYPEVPWRMQVKRPLHIDYTHGKAQTICIF